MMKITGLSHLFKWENLHNWWLTKYFFAFLAIARNIPVILITAFVLQGHTHTHTHTHTQIYAYTDIYIYIYIYIF